MIEILAGHTDIITSLLTYTNIMVNIQNKVCSYTLINNMLYIYNNNINIKYIK